MSTPSTPCIKGFVTINGEAFYDFYALGNLPEVLKTVPVARVGQLLCVESVNEDGTIKSVSAVDGGNISPGSSSSSQILLSDTVTGTVYKLFVDNGKLQMSASEGTNADNSITLTDKTSGIKYSICVSNGRLTMTESEE